MIELFGLPVLILVLLVLMIRLRRGQRRTNDELRLIASQLDYLRRELGKMTSAHSAPKDKPVFKTDSILTPPP